MTDPSLTPSPYEPHPELYSYEAAVNGEYAAVIHEPGEGCTSCDVSSDFYARLDAENDARWVRENAELAAAQADKEAGAVTDREWYGNRSSRTGASASYRLYISSSKCS